MTAVGQTRPRSHVRVAAALPPTTAVVLQRRERQFRANNRHMQRSKQQPYSITSSARSRIEVGIVTPIAFAVLRFTTSSKFVGSSTGKSAGLLP